MSCLNFWPLAVAFRLEVVPRDEGGVWIVEGHRRHRCYVRCRNAGKPVEYIACRSGVTTLTASHEL